MGGDWKGMNNEMSVIKSKRKKSQFEVFHHLTKMRQRITDLLLRDFGYSFEKFNKKLEKRYGGKSYEELTDAQKHDYDRQKKRNEAFDEWFVMRERETIMECLHALNEHVYVANSIYPTCQEELTERRLHQDIAIGQCFRMVQELQYAIETLPVDVNVYLRFAEDIEKEISLIKGWRQADNKFKKNFKEEIGD